jgi:hypothetical protein
MFGFDPVSFAVSNPIAALIMLALAYFAFFAKSGTAPSMSELLESLGNPDIAKILEFLRGRLSDPASRDQTVQLVESLKTETAAAALKAAKAKR